MIQANIKEEFDMYVHNVGLTEFVSDKCSQYLNLIDSFLRKFAYVPHQNSHIVFFNPYENPFRLDLDEFCEAREISFCGICTEPRKSDCNEFLLNITREKLEA